MTDQETQDMQKFHNRLRILSSIDWHELPEKWLHQSKVDFVENPIGFFIRCSDSKAEDLWWVLLKREGVFV